MVGNGRVLAAGTGVDREGPGQVREDAAGEEAADSPQASLPRALLQLPGQHQGPPPAGPEQLHWSYKELKKMLGLFLCGGC